MHLKERREAFAGVQEIRAENGRAGHSPCRKNGKYGAVQRHFQREQRGQDEGQGEM